MSSSRRHRSTPPPRHTRPGAVDVSVTTPAGTSATTLADEFSYENAPTVSSISPTSGAFAGGTSVTITGSGLNGASGVSFGTAAAGTLHGCLGHTRSSPPRRRRTAWTVDVRVTTPVATSATGTSDQFSYVATPSVTSVSPLAGSPLGGNTVTFNGINFTGVTAVEFGSVPATSYSVISSTKITAVSPAEAVGVVDVSVTTANGTSATRLADQFTYETGPTLSILSPDAGVLAGGTAVVRHRHQLHRRHRGRLRLHRRHELLGASRRPRSRSHRRLDQAASM